MIAEKLNKGMLVRVQAFVLVSLMIAAGTIAMAPAVLAGNGSGKTTFDLFEPHAIYGYVKEDSFALMSGIDVTVTNDRTGEFLQGTSDALGRYDVDLAGLTTGYLAGDLIVVTITSGYNSTTVDTLLPAQRVDIIMDLTDPASAASIVPAYDNTGTWNVDLTGDDVLVNNYASGIYSVDVYVETPATPGTFNLWTTDYDPFIGTFAYTPVDGEGVYYFYSVATDYAGNVEVKSVADDSIIYDITAPTSTVTGPLASDAFTFPLTYDAADPGAAPSGLAWVNIYYSDDGGNTWTFLIDSFGSPQTVTVPADGTYDWYTAAFDNAGNSEPEPPTDATFIEFTTIVDTVAPTIGATTVDKPYINSQGTFGGITPPVMVTTEITDDNLAAGGWAVRDYQQWEGTMYFSVDITNEIMPATYGWDGSWYHLDGVLVTAGISPFFAPAGDLFVMGEVNGATIPGDSIGNNLPTNYVTFQPDGTMPVVYSTEGTLDYSDDVVVAPVPGDTFRAYRYDEGAGYVATTAVYTFTVNPWVSNLTISPVPDGQYAVCVSAIDEAGNTAWTNETTPNPVITVDNFPPQATATGPQTSNVYTFDVTYTWVADPLPSSGLLNITLFYNRESAGWMTYGTDPTPNDGAFPVDVTLIGGDGTYEWCLVAFDNTDNREDAAIATEATTLVDTAAPTIGATTVDKLYFNNQGTFGGIAPPVMVTTEITDDNLAAGGWAVRDYQQWEGTMYFTVDITNEIMPATYGWDGSWYHLDGVLVTAGISPFFAPAGDLFVMGEVNGATVPGDSIGNNLPTNYVTFQPDGTMPVVYSTEGTLDYSDDVIVVPAPGDTFRAYRYDEGAGYVATTAVYTFTVNPWVSNLTISPVPDGQYAVCVSAIDEAGNTAWTNETTPNPVITVDNFAPDADATGPAYSNVYIFDITYTYVADPAPSSGLLNVSLWYNLDGNGWIWFAESSTLDGLFPVDISALGDGVYEWFIAAFDMAENHEALLFTAEATTVVDTVPPVIGTTGADLLYINNMGTYGGTAPPVWISTEVWDDHIAAAAWAIRDYQQWEGTMYFSVDITDDVKNDAMPAMYTWDGSWYHIDGALVTVSASPYSWGDDLFVMGEVNGASVPGDELGNALPTHYATFQPDGTYQGVYSTEGTFDYSDDVEVVPVGGETFRAYRYDEGAGYIATAAVSTYVAGNDWVVLTISPVPEGQYAVCVSAMDMAGATAWTNETSGNPVITVDNTQPMLNIAMEFTGDQNGNGFLNTGDWFLIWVNVTDLNEDATTMPIVDADEKLLPDQPMDGWTYYGLGVWEFTYIIQGPEFTTSNIDVSFRDLAGNLIDMPNALVYDIYGEVAVNYNAGWNLLGIPVLDPYLNGAPLDEANDLAVAGALMVSKWNFATQRYINYIPGFHTPADPQNFAIVEDEAYWAWMPTGGSFAVSGLNPGGRNVAVDGPGWNMISYMDPVNVGDVETDWAPYVSCGPVDDIAYYDGTTFIHYILPGTVMELTPSRGYFVWSDFPTNIMYNAAAWNTNTGIGYPTIQAAIDNANPYDTINVESGIYYEQLVITKPLTLQGSGSGIFSAGMGNTIDKTTPTEVTTIDASSSGGPIINPGFPWVGSAIAILSNDVTISGFEVSNSNTAGVFVYYAEDCHISDVRATYNNDGVVLFHSDYNVVDSCEASSNLNYGIWLEFSSDNDIINNMLDSNDLGINLYAESPGFCNYNTILGNTIQNHDFSAIFIEGDSNEVYQNRILYNFFGVQVWGDWNTIAKNSFIGNYHQGEDAYGTSTWNLPLPDGGNYWDIWTSPDDNGDGIVDVPYNSFSFMDNFPWTTENGWESYVPVDFTVVNTDTGEGFATIQAAIDHPHTLDGHTITVAAGQYYEDVVVDKQLTIQGAGATFSEIYPTGESAFDVRADYVTISGFFMQGNPCIIVGADSVSHNHITITENTLNGGHIYLDGVWDSTISNNIIEGSGWGIYLTAYEFYGTTTCGNIQIIDNYIGGSMVGIELHDATGGGIVIQGNTFRYISYTSIWAYGVFPGGPIWITMNNFMDNPFNGHAISDDFFTNVFWDQNFWEGIVGPYIPTGCVTQGDYNPAPAPWP